MLAWRGVIEGFYGQPWSWHERALVASTMAAHGMSDYVYAPKSDPLHLRAWRDPYDSESLDGFASIAGLEGVRLGFGISPGRSLDPDSGADRIALLGKIRSVVAAGAGAVVLGFDDLPPRPGLADEHVAVVRWVVDELDVPLLVVPTDYTSTTSTPYLDVLADGLPEQVAIAWTGPTVVCDELSAVQASARASALGGRPPVVWDNVPVNDALMTDRLFLGPLRGRDPRLLDVCSGWLANPMVQPRASLLPLVSVAAFCGGDDPVEAWRREADRLGVRTLADGCDGVLPMELAGAEDLSPLRTWLASAAEVDAGAFGAEVQPWVDQLRTEAAIGLALLGASTTTALMAALLRWQVARRAAVNVLGPRCSLRPVVGHDAQGDLVLHRESLLEDRNALDALARRRLADLARGG